MGSVGQSYGQTLPDQVERIASLFDAHLELIGDVREIYRDRAALEREYATKLQILVKKAAEKKSKIEALVVVGEDPTKVWNADMLRQNSLNAVYTEIMDSMVSTVQDHINIADALTSQVVDVLKAVEKKSEEAKKKEMQFFQKLLTDRDRVYAERLKSKQKYDEECIEIESYRQKQGRAQDDKHADRAAKQAEQQRNDMLNSKNVYLISIAVANKTKGQFYDANLPGLEDQFQILQRRLVERFTKILQHSQTLELGHLDALKGRINRVEMMLERIDPAKDQDLFIEYNIRPFTAPADWTFEPCLTHYDTGEMSTESTSKIFIQNKLIRCRSKLEELGPLIDTKRRELDQISAQLSSYTADHTLGKIDEISDNFLETKHQLVFYATSEKILQAEVETIVAAIGDDEGAQRPHSFKSSSFSIPTQCGYCKTSIWGLSKQGKSCKLCGISVHSKCELKVPADCQQADLSRRQSSVLSRQGTSMSRTSSRGLPPQAPTASSFVQSVASEESYEESYPTARVLFDFTATSEFELGVSEGTTVRVVEPDDGSGWVKVADAQGRDGLVPASYLEHGDVPATSSTKLPVTQGGSGQYVRAIYSYEAQGKDELSLTEGESVELTAGPAGGQSYGNGWWEGLDSNGRKGIFPSNYVEMA